MKPTVNLNDAAASLTDFWSPRIIGQVNDQYIKVAKLKGELTWHSHAGEDEMFLVLSGKLVIQYKDRENVHLAAGEIHVVPRGVIHNPLAREECRVALVETVTTLHTGSVIDPRTRTIEQQLKAGE